MDTVGASRSPANVILVGVVDFVDAHCIFPCLLAIAGRRAPPASLSSITTADVLLVYHHQQLPILLDPNRFPFLLLGVERILPFSAPDNQDRPIFRLPGTGAKALPFMAYSSGAFLGNVVEMMLLNSPEPYNLLRCFETPMFEALKAIATCSSHNASRPDRSASLWNILTGART